MQLIQCNARDVTSSVQEMPSNVSLTGINAEQVLNINLTGISAETKK